MVEKANPDRSAALGDAGGALLFLLRVRTLEDMDGSLRFLLGVAVGFYGREAVRVILEEIEA